MLKKRTFHTEFWCGATPRFKKAPKLLIGPEYWQVRLWITFALSSGSRPLGRRRCFQSDAARWRDLRQDRGVVHAGLISTSNEVIQLPDFSVYTQYASGGMDAFRNIGTAADELTTSSLVTIDIIHSAR